MKPIGLAVAILSLVACTGSQGSQGLTGESGATGPAGPAGPAGSPAKALLVSTSSEPTGTHCATGGAKLDFGLDADGDGVLEPSEIDPNQVRYLCNGAVGATGAAGLSVTATSLSVGDANCANGGSAFVSASGTTYVCNGAPGAPGQSVTASTLSLGDVHCANGGSAFTSASGTTYACNGAQGQTGPAGPGFTCANQGAVFFVSPYFKVDASCPALLLGSPVIGTTVHFAGSGSTATFTLQNVGGSGSISIISPAFIGPGTGYGISSDSCSSRSLAPGDSCSVTVKRGTSGSATDTFEIYTTTTAYTWPLASP